ncbi:unnamed protein product [Schistosoma rodhaini]|uniref:Charged multivesicular body protein 2b n=1 Tax=Schistosoma rodhaini TaxID=6188 RepID=A0AA85G1B7_9TREM|nr:unnamed protein product [Schistosoma rodhaini]CAH8595989.1 unnamed protein product [Schistosoma rodhaini]
MASVVIQKLKKAQKQGKEDNQAIQRSIGRNITELEREEKDLEDEIRRAAMKNNRAACTMLAQELTKIRALKSRNSRFADHMNIVQRKQTSSLYAAKYGESLEAAAKTMQNFNKVMDKTKVSGQLQQFDKEALQMDMSEDTLDTMLSSLCESDEENVDECITNILNEPPSYLPDIWPSLPDTPLTKSSSTSKQFRDNIV